MSVSDQPRTLGHSQPRVPLGPTSTIVARACARGRHAFRVGAMLAASVAALSGCSTGTRAQGTPQPRLLRAGDVDALPVQDPGQRIAYGTDSLQFGELRLPSGAGPFPVAIVIHGGCWYSPYANVRNSAPLAEAITAQGIATWNVEYRRYDQPGGGWPGTFRDVAQAADYVRVLARDFPVDTTRIVALGHSAGAQLAAWLPTRERLAPDSDLRVGTPITLHGVVALGGVMDMREYQVRELQTCGNPAIESVMGGLPSEVPTHYAQGSPIERLPIGVPQVHVAGALDRIAPRDVVMVFADSARALGDRVEVETVPGLGHHDVMSPRTAGGAAAVAAVRRLLRVER